MGSFRYRLLWLISLFLFASTKPGETLEQEDVGNPSKEQLLDERETTSKVMREKYHIQMENGIFNEWRSFQDWTCNAPQVEDYEISEFTEVVDGKQLHRIILFGGLIPGHSEWMRTTWIYYDEVNSWRTVDNLSVRPPGARPVSLTTVCNEYVILLLDLENRSTWVFMVKSKEWEEVAGDGDVLPDYVFASAQTVAVKDTRSACHCREAVLFIPCNILGFEVSSLHQLRCVNDSDRMSYRWTIISAKYPEDLEAHSIRCQSVVSSASKEMVFALIDGCVWYYEVSSTTWNSTASCFKGRRAFGIFQSHTVSAAVSEIDHNLTTYLSVDLVDLEVIRLNLSDLQATSERILGNGPPHKSVFFTRALSSVQFLAYAKEDYYSCGSSTWILKRDIASAIWFWSRSLIVTVGFPYSSDRLLISSIRYHNIYQLARSEYIKPGFETPHYELWVLDLNLMRWQVMQHFNVSEDIVFFDDEQASAWLEEDLWLIVLKSHTIVIKSRNQISMTINPMTRREYFTVVAVNETSVLLFGGLANDLNVSDTDGSGYFVEDISGDVLNDLWYFSSKTGSWDEVKFHHSGTLVPPPRGNHAAAVVGADMFVFGGHNNSDICFEELWKFNTVQSTWSIVEARNRGPRLAGLQRCVASAGAQAGQLWIVVGCDFDFDDICLDSEFQIWIFIVHLAIWEPLKVYYDNLLLQSLPFLRLGFWGEYLISLTNTQSNVLYMKVGCPAGLASRNISKVACNICEVGFYSAIGSKICQQCPRGTTTKTNRSTNINDCTVCVQRYCQYGRCLVVATNSTPSPYCQCQVGFTGSRCQYATYYYISLGVILFVMATALSLTIIWYIRRKKKISERLLGQQIQQLNEAWQIGWEEITVQDEIGGGVSGKVVLAQYRDTLVAVKMLITDDDPNDSLKFAEEIKFMQTMRHPNIVLFLGAGRTPEEQPFLVLEFIRRGSLRKVLDDDSIELSDRRKIDFAIDAAKGMAFLHNLNPPRIHRDLKGENLLVSESWVVKVADFGLGRSFNSEKTLQPAKRQKRWLLKRRSITQPLLEAGEELSLDGIGTARWSAPELSRREKYNGSIDVYRYTVVLNIYYQSVDAYCISVLELFCGKSGLVTFLSVTIGSVTLWLTRSKEASDLQSQATAQPVM